MTSPLDHLEKLASEATPGPWLKGIWAGQCHMSHPHGRGVCKYKYTLRTEEACVSLTKEGYELIGYDENGTVLNEKNAAYIAASNPATILTLIKIIRMQREALNFYDNECAQCADIAPCHTNIWAREALAETDSLLKTINKEKLVSWGRSPITSLPPGTRRKVFSVILTIIYLVVIAFLLFTYNKQVSEQRQEILKHCSECS